MIKNYTTLGKCIPFFSVAKKMCFFVNNALGSSFFQLLLLKSTVCFCSAFVYPIIQRSNLLFSVLSKSMEPSQRNPQKFVPIVVEKSIPIFQKYRRF